MFPNSGAHWDRFPNNKFTLLTIELPRSNDRYTRVQIIDDAQHLYDQSNIVQEDGRWVKTDSRAVKYSNDTRGLVIPVMDDGKDIIIKVWASDDDDIDMTTDPAYTLIIKTSGFNFG